MAIKDAFWADFTHSIVGELGVKASFGKMGRIPTWDTVRLDTRNIYTLLTDSQDLD